MPKHKVQIPLLQPYMEFGNHNLFKKPSILGGFFSYKYAIIEALIRYTKEDVYESIFAITYSSGICRFLLT